MKSTLYKLLAYLVILLLGFWPTSCKRLIDIELPPKPTDGVAIVKPNVYVLDSINNDQLTQLGRNFLLFKSAPTLRNGRVAAVYGVQNLKKGDILIGYPSKAAPNGFWARIEEISQVADGLRFDFSIPTFLDVFEKFEKKWQVSYGSGDAEVQGNGTRNSWLWTLNLPIRVEAPLRDENDVLVGRAEGNITLSAGASVVTTYELVIEDSKWKKILIETKVNKALKAAYELAGTVALAPDRNLICHNFKPFVVPEVPVPIVIRPVLRLDVGVELSGTMKMGGQVTAMEEESSVGIHYDGTKWNEIKSEKKNPITGSTEFEVSGKVEAWLEVKGQGYFYQYFPVDCDNEPDVELSFGLGVKAFIGAEGLCKVLGQGDSELKTYYGLEGKMFAKMQLLDVLSFEPTTSLKWQVDNARTVNWSICKSTKQPIPNEVEEDATAVSTADPHLTTFDRGRYSFMGVGEFVAAKSTTDNFLVQVRQSPYPGSTLVSVNTGVAVRVGADVVSVYPPNRLYVNRRTVPLNFTTYALSNGGSLVYQGNRLTISTTSDDRVEVKLLAADLDYFITPAKARKNKLRGLLGNYDGNPQNDLQKADGQVLTNTHADLYPGFANSWRINQTESLFDYDGKDPASFTDVSFPRSEVQLSAAQRSAAEQICRQAGVTDAGALEGCIVDVALTGNQTFATRAKENEIVSNAKITLSVSNFAQYLSEFMLGSGATISGNTALLANKGTIRWQDAYINREGYETEVVLSVNAPGPCFPLFDLEVIDNQTTGNPNDNYLRLSANSGRTQVELVNSGVQPQAHPVNLFDGNRHRIRVVATKGANGAQTLVRLLIYIDNYDALIIDKTFATASLAGYLYPMLKNETLYCTNSQITIYGWSFKGE